MENKLKVALIGYGSMGREINSIALENDVEITSVFDIDNKIDKNGTYDFDVAIDFSLPDAVLSNTETIASLGKNIVVGTTGWFDKVDEINKIVSDSGIGLVYASNFSIGMLIFNQLVETASKLIKQNKSYDIFLHEFHHKRKKDSPSGTALSLAEIVLRNSETKKNIKTDKADGLISPSDFHVSSTRGGEIFGTHSVFLDSFADTIELTHRAKSRRGFAEGAIEAAKWINGKKGMYRFEDIFKHI